MPRAYGEAAAVLYGEALRSSTARPSPVVASPGRAPAASAARPPPRPRVRRLGRARRQPRPPAAVLYCATCALLRHSGWRNRAHMALLPAGRVSATHRTSPASPCSFRPSTEMFVQAADRDVRSGRRPRSCRTRRQQHCRTSRSMRARRSLRRPARFLSAASIGSSAGPRGRPCCGQQARSRSRRTAPLVCASVSLSLSLSLRRTG